MELTQQRALVTGGSRGIGREVCLVLAARGARVAVNCAGSLEAARKVVDQCLELGAPDAFVVQANVADPEQVQQMVEQVTGRWGGVDILVNNAGITRDGLLMRMADDAFAAVLDTNLKGAFYCLRAVARGMMKQRSGRIVNLSSVVGLRGNAGQANYAASKAGLIGLAKSAAKELASRGVTVNCVAPGFIDTDMTAVLPDGVKENILSQIPMGRLGAAKEVADAVAFLASPQAGYITGQVLCVDGGMAM